MAGYKKLAFVGKWREACPGTGVDIIDISRPFAPVKVADTLDYLDTSMEDLQALEVAGRDVLAIGLQDCNNDPTPGVGKGGLELYDISDPATRSSCRSSTWMPSGPISAESTSWTSPPPRAGGPSLSCPCPTWRPPPPIPPG